MYFQRLDNNENKTPEKCLTNVNFVLLKLLIYIDFIIFLVRIQLETSFYPIGNFKLKTKQKTVY
jgi:hypothetical protein